MNLHLRVLIGYYTLVGFLVVCAVGAALGFNHLADSLSGDTERTREAQSTLGLLARLDHHDALLRRALRGDLEARADVQKGFADLETAIGGGEGAAETRRNAAWSLARYREVSERLLEAPSLESDEGPVVDALRAVKVQLYQSLEEEVRQTIEREADVEIRARRYATVYGTLLALALIVIAFLSRQLRRGLVDRMVATASVAQAVADGDRSRRAHPGNDDELGIVAQVMNYLLDTELALHSEMEGRLGQQRQLLLGLVDSWPKKVALFTIYGDLAASSLGEEEREELQAAEVKFPAPPAQPRDDHEFVTTVGPRELRFRLLRAGGRRPVGWLAEVD